MEKSIKIYKKNIEMFQSKTERSFGNTIIRLLLLQ